MKVRLPQDADRFLREVSRRAWPRECCGLVEGAVEDGLYRVALLHPARNLAAGNSDFLIAPEDHFAALRAARERGTAIIGCYHSHPGGAAMPSASDRAGAVDAAQDGSLWLILALARPDDAGSLRGFVYSGRDFVEAGWATGADLVTSSL